MDASLPGFDRVVRRSVGLEGGAAAERRGWN